jgi:AcrR family transcriptional regulator
MPIRKLASVTSPDPTRSDTRVRVLDAAERLLRAGGAAEFSMRDLAAEAGLSFATPFNQFGSKTGIMQALSARRIDAMEERFARAAPAGDVADRVLAAVDIAVSVLLEEPTVSRRVIGSLGSPTEEPGRTAERSHALWTSALGKLDGILPALVEVAAASLAYQLALGFRGCLSFWVAGEIADADLPIRARGIAAALLFGFVNPARRRLLATQLAAPQPALK